MHPLKALGPDSMPLLFYQHFWPTVKSIVITTAFDFLNHGIAPPHFHDTHIALIPKTKNPKCVTNYKPISLCNMAYKLASKVVANRMEIVCKNQSTFVAEKLITDNVLVAHEMMTHISRKKKGKCGEKSL